MIIGYFEIIILNNKGGAYVVVVEDFQEQPLVSYFTMNDRFNFFLAIGKVDVLVVFKFSDAFLEIAKAKIEEAL
jgi:hypothetical protein